ncbi:MAG TPA: hypothetical protein VHQ90_04650 [Thermoanaerobaculia bacterium]|nr:hypothetical protein [Thermoanaerobaculia bacterium]
MEYQSAISIPDKVFEDAQGFARQLEISRSQLYSRALSEYVSRHAPDRVTESLDRLYADLGVEQEDLPVSTASRRILERTKW